MRRSFVTLLIAAGVAACGGETSNEFGRSDKEEAQELAAKACEHYGLISSSSVRVGGLGGGERFLAVVARGPAPKASSAARLDSRWNSLSVAMSDPASKGDVIQTECALARAK